MVAGCFVFEMDAVLLAKLCPWLASRACQHQRHACVPAATAQDKLRGDAAQQQSFRAFAGASSQPMGTVYVSSLRT